MKRKDALRKVRTICQRLDEAEPQSFPVQPLQLYLYGSVLTDKPDPRDVDLILVYEYPPDFDFGKEVTASTYGKPTAVDRAIIILRQGMKMIRISPARASLENWNDQALLLNIRPRLIWKPGAHWGPVVAEIEASPEPWTGPRSSDAQERHYEFVQSLSREEYHARLAKILADIEAQQLEL